MWQVHSMAHVWTARAVAQYFRNKGQNHARWIGGMQKMQARHAEGAQPSASSGKIVRIRELARMRRTAWQTGRTRF